MIVARNPFDAPTVESRRGGPVKPPLGRDAIVADALRQITTPRTQGMSLRAVAAALDTGPATPRPRPACVCNGSCRPERVAHHRDALVVARGRGLNLATGAWAVDLLTLYVTANVAAHANGLDPAAPGGAIARAIAGASERDYPRSRRHGPTCCQARAQSGSPGRRCPVARYPANTSHTRRQRSPATVASAKALARVR
jgi:hypothetical protein